MALEEITFENTNGEEINLSNIVNQMINYYVLKLEVGETRVTDFNEGSEIRNILEAFAIAIYALLEEQHEATEIAFISTSHDSWLDRIGELPFIDLPRYVADNSKGEVTFTLGTAQSDDFIIPADTILACSTTGLEFVTTADCVIGVGELSGDAPAECLTTGADGNVAAESIDTVSGEFVDTELVSVSNQARFDGGVDAEEDEEYRQRLLDNVRADGFGTLGYYTNLAESVDGVHDVKLVSDASYTRRLLVNGDVKPLPDKVLLDVLAAFTDIDNLVLDHTFTAVSVGYTSVSLEVELDVVTSLSDDDLSLAMQLLFDGGDAFSMTYEGLHIDESLTRERIANALLLFDDVVDVTSIVADDSEVSVLSPDSNKVLRLVDVSFTQNEV